MPFIRRVDFRNTIPKIRSLLTIASVFSLTSLIIDAYKIPITEVIKNLLSVYDVILAKTAGQAANWINKILNFLGYEFTIPDSWRHLFIWLIFYFSTFWYSPNSDTKHARLSGRFLTALSILVAFSWSLFIANMFPSPQTAAEVILAAFLLMISTYLYEILQIFARIHFDLKLENEKYNKNESQTEYFSRQHAVAIKVFFVLGISGITFSLACLAYEIKPTISLLLLIFCISMALNHYKLALRDTHVRSRQSINRTKTKSKIFFSTGNAIMATNFAIPVLMVFLTVALGYHLR